MCSARTNVRKRAGTSQALAARTWSLICGSILFLFTRSSPRYINPFTVKRNVYFQGVKYLSILLVGEVYSGGLIFFLLKSSRNRGGILWDVLEIKWP